ncbi:MAG TPA: DUF222 domain-containing protein [Acidimicrobiales bacterium]|nr:DUF222 domain-containing protein [Acidimicrobiales bacterium]
MERSRVWPVPAAVVGGADFDALVALVPGASSEEELRQALVMVDRLRARLDGVAAGLVGSFDARCVWAADGARDAAGWVAARTDASRSSASAEVRVARAVRDMPAVEVAAVTGRLGREKVRALAWARQPGLEEAFALCEEQLVTEVTGTTVAGAWCYLRRWVADVRARLGVNELDGAAPTEGTGRSKVTLATGLDGRWFGSLDLEAEDGEILATAVDHQVQAMWDRGAFTAEDGMTAPERRARALVEVLTRGTHGGTGDSTARPLVLALTDTATLHGRAPAPREGGPCRPEPATTHPATIDPPAAFDELVTPEGSVILALSELSRSGPVPPETIRRMACEGDVVPVTVARDGTPLDMGRRSRLATRAQRRALRIRDQHCTFAGCTAPAEHCIAHHLTHWEHGGPTDLANLTLLCRHHHRLVHEGGFTLARGPDGHLGTIRPDDTPVTGHRPHTTSPLHRHRPPSGRRHPRSVDPDSAPESEALQITRATRERIDALVVQARRQRGEIVAIGCTMPRGWQPPPGP